MSGSGTDAFSSMNIRVDQAAESRPFSASDGGGTAAWGGAEGGGVLGHGGSSDNDNEKTKGERGRNRHEERAN